MRHNALRDTEAKLYMEVGCDVKTEQELLPTGSDDVSSNSADKARLDFRQEVSGANVREGVNIDSSATSTQCRHVLNGPAIPHTNCIAKFLFANGITTFRQWK